MARPEQDPKPKVHVTQTQIQPISPYMMFHGRVVWFSKIIPTLARRMPSTARHGF